MAPMRVSCCNWSLLWAYHCNKPHVSQLLCYRCILGMAVATLVWPACYCRLKEVCIVTFPTTCSMISFKKIASQVIKNPWPCAINTLTSVLTCATVVWNAAYPFIAHFLEKWRKGPHFPSLFSLWILDTKAYFIHLYILVMFEACHFNAANRK